MLTALLWAAGTTGTHCREPSEGWLLLDAFFPADHPEESSQESKAQGRLDAQGGRFDLPLPPRVTLVDEDLLEDQDWMESYRQWAVPLAVGERFLLDPREPGGSLEPTERIALHLPARQAFGTGSHESTRLVLRLMESRGWSGRRVLDVGSGSGVLSFAALALGAGTALGIEIDLASALQAGSNRRLNGLWPSFVAGSLACLEGREPFDDILINILPERILPDFHHVPPLLNRDGNLFFSGILGERRGEVLEAIGEWGFHAEEECGEGDWIALRCRR